jgi:hypothetical protein
VRVHSGPAPLSVPTANHAVLRNTRLIQGDTRAHSSDGGGANCSEMRCCLVPVSGPDTCPCRLIHTLLLDAGGSPTHTLRTPCAHTQSCRTGAHQMPDLSTGCCCTEGATRPCEGQESHRLWRCGGAHSRMRGRIQLLHNCGLRALSNERTRAAVCCSGSTGPRQSVWGPAQGEWRCLHLPQLCQATP